MNIFPFIISFFLALFSTAVLLYISIATYIGPWITPTVALLAVMAARLYTRIADAQSLALITCAGSVGGIMATAIGFSFPTLYFVDQPLFMYYVQTPMMFISVVTGLTLCASFFGLFVAECSEHELLGTQQLSFPVGQMVFQIINTAHQSIRQSYELLIGFGSSFVFSLLQEGSCFFRGYIPTTVTLIGLHSYRFFIIPSVSLMLSPFLWAIGFITGYLIALPLIGGIVVRYICIEPLSHIFFPHVTSESFILAFCSGMVLYSVLHSFWHLIRPLYHKGFKTDLFNIYLFTHVTSSLSREKIVVVGVFFLGMVLFLSWLGFSLVSQMYLLITTYVCTYVIAGLAGKMGLAPLGRFATFVMVPALFIFRLQKIHYICMAAFVEVAGGVAADVLAGRVIGYACNVPRARIRYFQIFGIIVSACTLSILFLFLVQKFSLGSPDFFAGRAQSRALLLSVSSFNYTVLVLGALCGVVLQCSKMNTLLVLGGILMPLSYSLGLIIGSLGSFSVKDPEKWTPFWSGVFAAGSFATLIQGLCRS